MNPVARIREFPNGLAWLRLWCPGCQLVHTPVTSGDGGPVGVWNWNGDLERPTLSPSILARTGGLRCHSFVRNGQWQYLGDCTHDLAGQTIDLPPLPDWVMAED